MLQEVFAYKSYIIIEARRNGFPYVAWGPSPAISKLKFICSGLVIISRYELTDIKKLRFSEAKQVDAIAAKGILMASVALGPRDSDKIELVNTHTQAIYNPKDNKYASVLKSQLDELVHFVQTQRNPNAALLIGGDFNMNRLDKTSLSGAQMYEYLESRMRSFLHAESLFRHPVITFGDARNGKPVDPALNVIASPEQLDYFFWKRSETLIISILGETNKARVEGMESNLDTPFKYLSDHYGITTTVIRF